MSRIGKQFIAIPNKVSVKLDGQKVLVDGPKGSLSRILPSLVCCTLDEESQKLFIEKTQETKERETIVLNHGQNQNSFTNFKTSS